jgi:hypothetical protein
MFDKSRLLENQQVAGKDESLYGLSQSEKDVHVPIHLSLKKEIIMSLKIASLTLIWRILNVICC